MLFSVYFLSLDLNSSPTTLFRSREARASSPVRGLQAWQQCVVQRSFPLAPHRSRYPTRCGASGKDRCTTRSEEHTSELQSLRQLVCRLLPEKKNPREVSFSALRG